MKRLLYIIAIFTSIGLSSCNDVEIGYLMTDKANYAIDTLVVTRFSNFENELEKLEARLNSYPERVNVLLDSISILNAEIDVYMEEYNRLEAIMAIASDNFSNYIYDKYPDWDIDYEDEKVIRLMAIYEEAMIKADNYWSEHITPLNSLKWDYQDEINEICRDEGLERPTSLFAEKEALERQIAEEIPWTTSTIQQLSGTSPMTYSLIGVRSDNGQEAADDFASHLTVIGGGRMYVNSKVDSPAGKYYVSLRVKNEGHTAELPDIFTFILK